MTDAHENDLLRALANLPREEAPPPELERRIVETLRRERLFRRQSSWRHLAAAAALLAATFVGGFAAGNVRTDEALGTTHILLVYELAARPEEGNSRERAAEYGRWARSLAVEHRLTGGEELAEEGWVLDRAGVRPQAQSKIGGYFLLHAPSDETARAIALTCPHLRHGGRLELRRIRN